MRQTEVKIMKERKKGRKKEKRRKKERKKDGYVCVFKMY
jgi:hypothetical protein